MRLRRSVVNGLYGLASACCHVADWLSPTTDELWRDRRWSEFRSDQAKAHDGPPL